MGDNLNQVSTAGVHGGEVAVRDLPNSRVPDSLGRYRTLLIGSLYVATIISVLALVAWLQ